MTYEYDNRPTTSLPPRPTLYDKPVWRPAPRALAIMLATGLPFWAVACWLIWRAL